MIRARYLGGAAAIAAALAVSACGGTSTAEPVPPAGRYGESPMLRERVESGELPPVEERLPDQPMVVETPEIGEYGGSIGGDGVIQSDQWRRSR